MAYNLLKQLTKSDYDELIRQVEFAQKGYDFYFVIDADLIGNYCYPRGIVPGETFNNRLNKLTVDYLSDEQITLHSLFYMPENNYKVLLLDEYLYEVEGMLYKAIKTGQNKINNLDIDFGNFKLGKEDKLLSLMCNYFANMFTKVLLHVDGVKKAKNLLESNNVILDIEKLPNTICKEIINEADLKPKNVELIKQIILDVYNRGEKQQQKLLTSRNRDALIIDRLLNFNSVAAKRKAKQIYIFLSDTPIIKHTLNSIQNSRTKTTYTKHDRKKIELFRNVPQSFVYMICLSYNKDEVNYNETIKNIKKLRDTSYELNKRFKEVSSYNHTNYDDFTETKIFSKYREIRNAYENSGLLKSFNPLYDSIKSEFKQKSIEDISEIFKAYSKEGSSIFKEVELKHIYFLKKLSKIGEFNSVFIYGIDQINNQGEYFDLSKGSDFVEGTFHHLPYYLTFSKSIGKYRRKMSELIDLVLNRKFEKSKDICIKLKDLLDVMNSSKLFDLEKTDINLIKAFIFMILPSQNIIDGVKENDKLANSWLLDLDISDDETACNKAYLQIWTLRRIKKYKESSILARKYIKLYPDDPRFYHGLFLSDYCISEERGNMNRRLIQKNLNNLKKASDLYSNFIIDSFKDQPIMPNMLKAMDETYANSYTYCLLLLAGTMDIKNEHQKYISLLIEARTLFTTLKNAEGMFYNELSEYFDTEAYLEYLESFYVENKMSKLLYSETAILKARRLSNNQLLTVKYTDRLNMIKKRMVDINKK